MSIVDDLDHFSKVVNKVGNLGIGDYLKLALLNSSMIHSKDPYWWFVDPASGSDAYDGDSWEQPFQTIQAAVDAAGDGRGDTIFLLSGRGTDYDDDTVGASLANAYVYINKADLNIIGLGPPNSVVINPDAAATAGVFNLGAGADRCRIANITFKTTTAQSAAIKLTAGTDFLTVDNCIFDLVGAAGPLGIGIDGDAGKVSYPVIRNCTFWLGTLIKSGIVLEVQDATPYGGLIENCRFVSVLNGSGTGCVDVINIKDGTGMVIKDCVIHGGDSGTAYNADDGIDIDAGVLNTLVVNCKISGCDALITDGGTDTDSIFNITDDGEGGEWADAETYIGAA